jgi:hypothetical protein
MKSIKYILLSLMMWVASACGEDPLDINQDPNVSTNLDLGNTL